MSDYGKNKKPINHVKCDVENCIHNNHECCCTAKEIKVGPQVASCCSDTICQSFEKQR